MSGHETDEFIGSVFGDKGQLTVLSWDGHKHRYNKLYTVKCSICSQDPEMFGDGCFLYLKGHLLEGKHPCGCSKAPKLNREQVILKIKRACESLGYTFIRIHGEYLKTRSLVIASCPVHGQLKPKEAMLYISGRGCIECRRDLVRDVLRLPDSHFIEKFIATGNFHPETKFTRSERLTPAPKYRQGVRNHWFVSCPACGQKVEGHVHALLDGCSPCSCACYGKVFLYINEIINDGECIALKYGVATNPDKRLSSQNNNCKYTVRRLKLWRFDNSSNCRSTETEIKRRIGSSYLSKEEMMDGWTETCSPVYFDSIVSIVEQAGGRE